MQSQDLEYLTFILDDEEFGIDILCVQEIKGWSPVTRIPNTPAYLKGVINLRGVIVPIVDLQERFGRQPTDYDETTVVIVLRTQSGNKKQVIVGIVVDAVSEVYKVDNENIKPAPDFGRDIDSRFIQGMAVIGEKLIILLDSQNLLNVEELYHISHNINAATITEQQEPADINT